MAASVPTRSCSAPRPTSKETFCTKPSLSRPAPSSRAIAATRTIRLPATPACVRGPKARSCACLFEIVDLFLGLAADCLRQRGSHEGIEVPIENIIGGPAFDAGPQVLHELIGLQDVGADLVAPADVGLFANEGAGL